MYWLRTFGGFTLERDGAPLGQVGVHRKALALLAVLAAHGGVGRERLMALLWPESDAERARGSLNQAVHLLRRQLGPSDLLLGTTELRLNPERIESDVNLFSRALDEGDAAAAIQHYGGPFLDGVHLDGSPEFERWAGARSAELERRYLDALEQLACAAEERGEHVAAAGWWRRHQGVDPLNGRAAVRLMLALEAVGDRAAALGHARHHERILREEWGITPDDTVTALAERLRLEGAPPAPQRPAPQRAPGDVPERGFPARSGDEREAQVDRPVARSRVAAGAPGPAGRGPAGLLVLLVVLAAVGAVVLAAGSRSPAASGAREGRDPRPPSVAEFGAPEGGSIAVLPFVDLSPERDQEYFTDGMTEELIATLSQVEGLRVSARSSAFQFKGVAPDVREVRERLGVAHVLGGSVRKAGERLRVSVQLVSTEDGFHVWSETFERPLVDVFAVQEEISLAIVEALWVRLGAGQDAPLVTAPTADFDAYETYLKGLHFLNRLQIPQAIEYLGEATRLDPEFARAHAALAEAYAVPAAYSDVSLLDAQARGVAAAGAALRLDPSLAEAHAALGWLEMIGLRWAEAGRALRRAVELDPRSPRARLYLGLYLHRQGQLDDAFAELQRARASDPLSAPIGAIYGSFLGDLGRTDEAVAHLKATLELNPSFPIAHAVLGHLYLGTGRTDEAIEHYERVAEAVPTSFYAGFLGHAYARAGRTQEARGTLAELSARTDRGEYVSPGAIGWIHLGLEEREEGFRWLERAVQQRDVFLTVYAVLSNEHLSRPFRDDPRFRQVRRSAGLER